MVLKGSVGKRFLNFHGSGAVGKGQQLKKQRSREASESWKEVIKRKSKKLRLSKSILLKVIKSD